MPLGSYVQYCPCCDLIAPTDHIQPCKHGGPSHCAECAPHCSHACAPRRPLPKTAGALTYILKTEREALGK